MNVPAFLFHSRISNTRRSFTVLIDNQAFSAYQNHDYLIIKAQLADQGHIQACAQPIEPILIAHQLPVMDSTDLHAELANYKHYHLADQQGDSLFSQVINLEFAMAKEACQENAISFFSLILHNFRLIADSAWKLTGSWMFILLSLTFWWRY